MQTDQLIEQLASGLEPVGRLRSPLERALLWLLPVGVISAVLILRFAQMGPAMQRLSDPQVALELAASALTAITAIIAAFELSIPDRSPHWMWLPLPPLLLWLGASGMGCLSHGLGWHGADNLFGHSSHCFVFIIATSVPLAIVLFAMLRRARPLNPLPVAALGTLGVAASAASILEFFHPFDVTVIDLALHLIAIGAVILIGALLRRPLLASA
jgi:hypothetical protein